MKRVLTTIAAMVWAAGALAHTHLHSSAPADKSKVTAPKTIDLHFPEAVRVTALSLQQGSTPAKTLDVPAKAAKDISVPVSALAPGDYKVSWRAASGDGHIMTGSFAFTVVGANAVASQAAPAHDHSQAHQH